MRIELFDGPRLIRLHDSANDVAASGDYRYAQRGSLAEVHRNAQGCAATQKRHHRKGLGDIEPIHGVLAVAQASIAIPENKAAPPAPMVPPAATLIREQNTYLSLCVEQKDESYRMAQAPCQGGGTGLALDGVCKAGTGTAVVHVLCLARIYHRTVRLHLSGEGGAPW